MEKKFGKSMKPQLQYRKIEDTDKLEFIEKWMDWIRKGRKEA